MKGNTRDEDGPPRSASRDAGTWANDLLQPRDLLLASGLLASGSFLLFLSSIALNEMPFRDIRLLVLAYPAIFLHFLGWGALAGLMTEPEGGRPEDPLLLRRRGIIFTANVIAFAVGLLLLFLISSLIPSIPALLLIYGAFFVPFVPVVYAPVTFVHAGLFLWSSGALRATEHRLLVRWASVALVSVAAIGFFAQLAYPERVLELAPIAGLTVVGYTLAALGWGLAYRDEPHPISSPG